MVDCQRCGLDVTGVVAKELEDLEATARQLEKFRKFNSLPADILDRIWEAVEHRHDLLTGTSKKKVPASIIPPLPIPAAETTTEEQIPPTIPVTESNSEVPVSEWIPSETIHPKEHLEVDSPPAKPKEIPKPSSPDPEPFKPWYRLREILQHNHPRGLTSALKVQVILLFRQSPENKIKEFSPNLQFRLAQVLENSQLKKEALEIFQRLHQGCPDHPESSAIQAALSRLQEEIPKSGFWKKLSGKFSAAKPQFSSEQSSGQIPETNSAASTTESAEEGTTPQDKNRVGKILAGFLEERNILWGELVGGLLIIGGSIALVVSLWNQLQQNPFFPFAIFAAISTALFLLGFYSHRHWKLEATSRGMMLIATLLVPLTFMVMPSMLDPGSGDLLELGIGILALAGFGWFMYRSGMVFLPENSWLLPVAPLGCCAGQIFVSLVVIDAQPGLPVLLMLGILSVGFLAFPVLFFLLTLRKKEELSSTNCISLIALLGTGIFALAVYMGLLIVRCPDSAGAVRGLASLFSLAGIPILISGLFLQKKTHSFERQTNFQPIGTGIALFGGFILLAAVAFSWPSSISLFLVCAINIVSYTWLAFRYQWPILHAPSLLCIALAYLVGVHLIGETHLLTGVDAAYLFGSTTTGIRLILFTLAIAAVSEIFARYRFHSHSVAYAWGSGVFGACALLLSASRGLVDTWIPTFVFFLFSIQLLGLNLRQRQQWVSYLSFSVLTLAVLYGLQTWAPARFPVWGSVLALETMLFALVSVLLQKKKHEKDSIAAPFVNPLWHLGILVSLISILATFASGATGPWNQYHVAATLLLSGYYLLFTAVKPNQITGALSGVMLIASGIAATEWTCNLLEVSDLLGVLGLVVSCLAIVMAGCCCWIRLQLGKDSWLTTLALTWREVVTAASLLVVGFIFQSETYSQAIIHSYSILVLSLTAFLLSSQYRSSIPTIVGSFLLLVSLGHWFRLGLELTTIRSLVVALLLHSSILLVSGIAGRRLIKSQWKEQASKWYVLPWIRGGILTTFLALPLLFLDPGTNLPIALFSAWAVGNLLLIAWTSQSKLLWAASQIVSILSVCFAVNCWLEFQPWVMSISTSGFLDPRSLQAYGIGLAFLCILWVAARIGLQNTSRGQKLLLPDWPGVDRILIGFLVFGHLGLVDWGALREVVAELAPPGYTAWQQIWPAISHHAFGPGAWLLLVMTSILLFLSLWQPEPRSRQKQAISGFALLSITLAALIAGNLFTETRSVASGVRWVFAIVYCLVSTCFWLRPFISTIATKVGIHTKFEEDIAFRFRLWLFDGLVIPVILITGTVMAFAIGNIPSNGFTNASIYHQMGTIPLMMIPLALILITLVGHSIREKTPVPSFVAGILGAAVVGGTYSIQVINTGTGFGTENLVRLLELTATTFAGWSLLCFLSRKWFTTWEQDKFLTRMLMIIQVVFPWILQVVLLGVGIYFLLPMDRPSELKFGRIWYPESSHWTTTAGGVLGWITLVTNFWALFFLKRRSLGPALSGLTFLAFTSLLSFSVEAIFPGWGYRTWILGLSLISLAWAVIPFLTLPRENPLYRSAPIWVILTCLVTFVFTIAFSGMHQDFAWVSLVHLFAGTALISLGLQRQQEGALVGGNLLLVVASTSLLWNYNLNTPFLDWWVTLLQVVSITCFLVSLIWLFGNFIWKGRSEDEELSISHLLPLQLILGLLFAGIPWTVAFFYICSFPGNPNSSLLNQISSFSSWLTFVLAMMSASWYLIQTGRSLSMGHLVSTGLLTCSVLIAAGSVPWDSGDWWTYHVLMTVICLAAGLLLIGGWSTNWLHEDEQLDAQPLRVKIIRTLFPVGVVKLWVHGLGLLLVGMSFRATLYDPSNPVGSLIPLGTTIVLTLGLAIWTRQMFYGTILGCLFSYVGVQLWFASNSLGVSTLLSSYSISLGLASIFCLGLVVWWEKQASQSPPRKTGVGIFLNRLAWVSLFAPLIFLVLVLGNPSPSVYYWVELLPILAIPIALELVITLVLVNRFYPVPKKPYWENIDRFPNYRLFGNFALLLLLVLLVIGLTSDLLELGLFTGGFLTWVAWMIGFSSAFLLSLREIRQATGLAATLLYKAGLLGVLLLLHHCQFPPEPLLKWAGIILAGYFLLATIIGRMMIGNTFHKKEKPNPSWFLPAQLSLAILAFSLATWTSCSFSHFSEQIVGPIAAGLLGLGCFYYTNFLRQTDQRWGTLSRLNLLRYCTLLLASGTALLLAWSIIPAKADQVLFLRQVLTFMVVGGLTLVFGVLTPRFLPTQSSWLHSIFEIGRSYWICSLFLLVSIIATELVSYPPLENDLAVPLWVVVVVAVSIVALVASGIWFAVWPKYDPFSLQENWRPVYVYGAEVLLVLLFVHLRWTAPHLFTLSPSFIPFGLMLVAFLGVGLSELFTRLNLPVLAGPLKTTGLFLPLLPLVSFWANPLVDNFAEYAVNWFLASLLYLVVAISQKSGVYALISAFAANFGMWALLFYYRDYGFGFLSHPQMWLIPPAIILLVTEHLNRNKLTAVSRNALRYFGLVLLYVSSTADLFIAGLQDVSLSLVLAVLAILGILAGIHFRVRAFLFVGFSFLLLVIGARIWHAAVNQAQTWVWWVAVIVLGGTILTLFALFEKRRMEVLRMMEDFKRWN